jgi:hypothetical protein
VAEQRFGIRHVTLQVDHAPDEHPLLDIEGRAPVARPDH